MKKPNFKTAKVDFLFTLQSRHATVASEGSKKGRRKLHHKEVVIVTPRADGAENLDRCNLESHNDAPNTKLSPFAFPSKNGEMQEQEVTECNILPNDTLSQKVRFHRMKVAEKSCRRSVSGRQDL